MLMVIIPCISYETRFIHGHALALIFVLSHIIQIFTVNGLIFDILVIYTLFITNTPHLHLQHGQRPCIRLDSDPFLTADASIHLQMATLWPISGSYRQGLNISPHGQRPWIGFYLVHTQK